MHDAALEPAKHSAVVLASSDGASPPAGPRRGLGGARISGRAVTTPDGAPSVPTDGRATAATARARLPPPQLQLRPRAGLQRPGPRQVDRRQELISSSMRSCTAACTSRSCAAPSNRPARLAAGQRLDAATSPRPAARRSFGCIGSASASRSSSITSCSATARAPPDRPGGVDARTAALAVELALVAPGRQHQPEQRPRKNDYDVQCQAAACVGAVVVTSVAGFMARHAIWPKW